MKKFILLNLWILTVFFSFASNCYALSILGSDQRYLDYGYGNSNWSNMTNVLNSATNNNFSLVHAFDDLNLMLTYDALWVDLRESSNLLTATEVDNIKDFINTGRRVVIIGENSYWQDWNQQILSIVGGTFTNSDYDGNTTSIVSNELTSGVSTVYVPYGGLALGGISLFDKNFATIWGTNKNVLTILDVNIFSDRFWNQAQNSGFAENVASWIARSNSSTPQSSVPEPTSIVMLLFALGLLIISYKRSKSAV